MNKGFFLRLAKTNIKKNAKTYIPFMLTSMFTIMMFYNMCALSLNMGLDKMRGASSLKTILFLGTIVIAIFSIIFLFYTNSFLVKRRKKEFGLFNILGMEKRHIAKVLVLESVITSSISIVLGLAIGILLSKLLFLALLKLLSYEVTFGFEISPIAIIATIILFVITFTLTLLNTLRQLHFSKPIELLRGGNVGEKEPKTKWLLAIFGAICLGLAYFIALTTESPLLAMPMFFLAVLLVIAGTYFLFTAGSIAILKILRSNKKYYYHTNHFTAVSGMLYRMKQNAAGLSNICILSTMVLVMVSGTTALYFGMEDALSVRYPREIIVSKNNITDQQITEIDKVISNELAKLDVTAEDVNRLLSVELSTAKTDTRFDLVTENAEENDNNFVMAYFLSLDEYKKLGGKEELVNENDVLLYTEKGEFIGDKVQFGDAEFNVKSKLEELDIVQSNIGSILDSFYFIFKDDKAVLDAYKTFVGSDVTAPPYSYTNSFNLPENIDAETQIQLNDNINNAFNSLPETNETRHAFSSSKEDFRGDFLGVYGGLFFLGIFLGVLFLMATVLIIYYKQISEGYDDKERFEIMQKVGMSHSEVKKAIHSQVLTVFFLPLLAAGVHIAFAFKMITKLLAILSLTNIGLFALCMALTFIVFAVIYSIIYSLTAKAYYKIVQ